MRNFIALAASILILAFGPFLPIWVIALAALCVCVQVVWISLSKPWNEDKTKPGGKP